MMISEWKKAITLARFELSLGAAHFLLVFVFSIIIAFFIGTTLEEYLGNIGAVFDVLFIILFSVSSSLFKPTVTQYQKVGGELWASHIFIMQKQLPVQENVLIKSRFFIHITYSFSMLILTLIFTYPMISNIMTISEYVVFAIIWLAFSIYIGLIMPASDAGDYVNVKTILKSIIQIALFLIPLIFVFHQLFHVGIVAWTIILAKHFPFISIVGSIFLTIIGIKFWERYMKRTIRKIDYY